jgi:hypothetical protein
LTLALLTATLLSRKLTLLPLCPGTRFGIGGRDGVEACTDDGSCRLGGSADDGTCGADNGPYDTSLKHQGTGQNGCNDGGTAHGSDHGLVSPMCRDNHERVNRP